MATKQVLSPADARWGYSFGVDGLWSREKAAEWLGCSIRTVDRRCERGRIRRGKDPDTRMIAVCKRSVINFVSMMEE